MVLTSGVGLEIPQRAGRLGHGGIILCPSPVSLARAHLRLGPLRLGGRPPSVRGPSAERPLELDVRIPSAHVDWQEEFVTCTVGDTTHSGRHNLLVYLYNLTWSHRLVCPDSSPQRPFLAAVVVMYVVRRGLVALVLAASLSACTAADEGWFHVKLVSDTGGQICDQRELHRWDRLPQSRFGTSDTWRGSCSRRVIVILTVADGENNRW